MPWVDEKYSTAPVAIVNPDFQLALAEHIKDLSPEEKEAFSSGNAISIEALLGQIREFDETHSQTSRSRRCAGRVEQFFAALQGYLGGLAPFLQQATPISSLVIGGVNFIIGVCIHRSCLTCCADLSPLLQLGLKFVAFFEKLTDMICGLGDHLGYLAKYAAGFMSSPDVQQVCVVPYPE